MTDRPDPLTKLTRAEQDFIDTVVSKWPREQVLAELKRNLQTAVWIELATIPIYLYTYYSIRRVARSGENIREIDTFANAAGSAIMSVAVEEMLHMSLSSNILFALGEDPVLYGHSPGPYPTGLPFHNPTGAPGPDGSTEVLIPLAPFSYEQMWHFLQIEWPEPVDAIPLDRDWDTIGQFYSYIRCLIASGTVTDADFNVRGADAVDFQIQSYNYSPNNIDTASPRTRFDSWSLPDQPRSAAAVTDFANADDSEASGESPARHPATPLHTVTSVQDALSAIDTICDQGEGYDHTIFDDLSHHEASHYSKFLNLQAQLDQYHPGHLRERLPTPPEPPNRIEPSVTEAALGEVIVNLPVNPTSMGYLRIHQEDPDNRVNYKPLADFVNGLYQYMLIMTESIFKVADTGPAGGGQKLFFNNAMHRSMIWMLDKLAQSMRAYSLGDGTMLAPTFENIDLGHRTDAYANLQALESALHDQPYYSDVSYYTTMVTDLPDVSPYWGGVTPAPAAGAPVPSPYPFAAAPAWPKAIGEQPPLMPLHACMGLNSCKASDRFGLAGHRDPSSPGTLVTNDCAGQGYCATTADHSCHVLNDCRNQGGCGLYGTATELDNPGHNDCRGLGSCATPINAERFSSNGPNQGRSVWERAREVFEQQVYPQTRDALRAQGLTVPETPGPAPDPFGGTGPPYLWISADNTERSSFTACGQSGLSGAGGCV